MRLKLKLQGIGDEELAVLRQYCGAKEGYSREILTPAEMTLHGLHYANMRLFGWLNGHLHRFSLPQKSMDAFTRGQFNEYLRLVGLYFRSPLDIEEQDIFWDDNYEGEASFRNWLRRKYTAPFRFLGMTEQFMAARRIASVFIRENHTLQVIPSNQIGYVRKPLDEIKLDEAVTALDGGLGDLEERLTLEEILSGQPATPESVSQLCREAAVLFERNIKALDEMVGKITKMKLSEKITHRMMAEAMLPLNPKVLPLTDSLNYEFDFGDGWEISIALCDVYDNDNTGDEKLSAQVKQVMETGRPLCIAWTETCLLCRTWAASTATAISSKLSMARTRIPRKRCWYGRGASAGRGTSRRQKGCYERECQAGRQLALAQRGLRCILHPVSIPMRGQSPMSSDLAKAVGGLSRMNEVSPAQNPSLAFIHCEVPGKSQCELTTLQGMGGG